ncbi:LPXTG cell wall anchor domain-containing protein, partial [Bacillus wiedmannii]|uniref:LPXTG cell wall anchor domain-containing protein n=1 Tax=Bacillus wiedmannii TaxID=1890302 RepID=UPI003D9666A8
TKEVEGPKEEVKESATGLDQETKEENKNSLAATGGQVNTSTLLSGLALVLSALSMFVFRKKLFKK